MNTNIFNLYITILFFIIVIGTYWLFPCRSIIALLVLIVMHYITLNWYDYSYTVRKITSNVIPIYRHFHYIIKNKKNITLTKDKLKQLKLLEFKTMISFILLVLLFSFGFYFFEKNSYIL